ncbi:MAG: phosphoribosylanthranilate isomerase [Lachnospiraceae bacterium]|nr:phosphoribosylanthranilate isomerase [Lachnospiraceae bacterium]
MTKIKICGLQSEDDISYVNELQPDYIGFVFLQGKRRYITPEKAAHLRKFLNPSIQSVGVFVNESVGNVAALLQNDTIQLAQLHGQEDEAYAQELKRLCNKPIIKAFIIKTKDDIKKALTYPADYLLLDNGLGTGESFDWSLIQNIDRPFFLAGGLNPENVKEAIAVTHPYGVDTSSGVETECRKDYQKIKSFIHAVRYLELD